MKIKQLPVAKALKDGAEVINAQAGQILMTLFGYVNDPTSIHHEWALKMVAERVLPKALYDARPRAARPLPQGRAALSTYRGLGWKAELLRRLVAAWGWDAPTLQRLDRRRAWQIEAVREESELLMAELTRSHRLLTGFAQRHAAAGGIDPLEVNLLGRKLYSALERRPGKIDWVNLSGEGNLAESRLVLRPLRGGGWRLDRDGPGEEGTPLKVGDSLVEVLAWGHLNGILARGTHLAQKAPDAVPGQGELQRVRGALWRLLPGGQRPIAPLRALAEPLGAEAATAIVNLGVDPHAGLAKEGLQLTTTRSDPLCFGAARACLAAPVRSRCKGCSKACPSRLKA